LENILGFLSFWISAMKKCAITFLFISGLTSPLSFLANYWILTLDPDSEHRVFLCGLLMQSRITVNVVYMNILFFSFLFRVVLILHAEKGLVVNGLLNLTLFKQLYWLTVCSHLIVSFIFLLPFINGTFHETVRVKTCLLQNFSEQDINQFIEFKSLLLKVTIPVITLVYMKIFTLRVNRFMSGLCPGKKMSCIGIYRRNVIDLNLTLKLSYFFFLNPICYVFLAIATVKYLDNTYSNTTIFWIWSIRGFLFDMFVFLLPFYFELCEESIDEKRITVFYVRKPPTVLEPRRPFHKCNIGHKYSSSEAAVPVRIGPARIIQVREWTDDCKGKWKGKGTGKGNKKSPDSTVI
jgi:hypothetical protein